MRGAFRQLWRQPAFTIAVLASLTLGIGANAAMFALLNALLLRPIGAADPGSLIRLSALDEAGVDRGLTSALVDALRLDDAAAGTCAVLTPLAAVEMRGTTAPRPAHAVSGRCLDVLGARPALGRLLTDGDARPGAEPVAVLAHRMWQRDYAGRPDAVGKTDRRRRSNGDHRRCHRGGVHGRSARLRPAVVYPIARSRSA